MRFLIFIFTFLFLIPAKIEAKVIDGIKNQTIEISARKKKRYYAKKTYRKRYVYKRYRTYSKAYRVKRHAAWVAPKRKFHKVRKSAGASRSCLTAQTASILNALEARIGRVSIVSTCRPGAIIAGTNRPSYHRYGMAVDFHTQNKAAAIAFLKTQPVLVMTYYNMNHIHFNTGQKGYIAAANAYGSGKRYARKSKHYYTATKRYRY